MIPFKLFIQFIFALHLSNDSKANQHLCAGIREAKNFQQNMQACDFAGIEDFNCHDLYQNKCEVTDGNSSLSKM